MVEPGVHVGRVDHREIGPPAGLQRSTFRLEPDRTGVHKKGESKPPWILIIVIMLLLAAGAAVAVIFLLS